MKKRKQAGRAAIRCLQFGLLAGVLAAVGCGSGGTAVSGSSSGTFSPPPSPVPALTMYNSDVKFGDVAVGAAVTYGVTLSATGGVPVTLQQNSLSGTGFATTGVGQGVTLEPGQFVTLAVTFNPSNAGTANGMVSLTSNTSSSAINLPLSGNGVVAGHSTTLNWDASQSAVIGYNIYRTPASFESWTKLNSSPVIATSYTDWDVLGGSSYLFMVTSVSESNVESSSAPATLATIPTP